MQLRDVRKREDGISLALQSHWTRLHRGDEMWKHRVQLLPSSGKMKYCVVHFKMRVCPTLLVDYRPSYYAVPTGPQNMARVNTSEWSYHTCKIWVPLMDADADVRIHCWRTRLTQIRDIHLGKSISPMVDEIWHSSYLRVIGRYPNIPVSMLFNDKDQSQK